MFMKKFMQEYKLLKENEVELVKNGLKQFFMIYAIAVSEGKTPRKGFMMPSKVVDELWHNFILDSRNYEEFCDLAFGKMLHHKPGENTTGNKKLDKLSKYPEELKNTYKHISDLKYHTKLAVIGSIPLLFALDQHFNVDNGFYYNEVVMNNIFLSLDKPSSTSSDSGSCGGIFAIETGSCNSSDSGGGCGGCGD